MLELALDAKFTEQQMSEMLTFSCSLMELEWISWLAKVQIYKYIYLSIVHIQVYVLSTSLFTSVWNQSQLFKQL